MNDALIGVVLGGLVAWVAPLLTLRYTERRWRFEANISYLKTERDRFEKLYEVNLKRFTSGVIENSYSPELTAEIITIMPDEIRDLYVEWLNENEKTDSKRKFVCLNMAVKMKKDLAKKDLEIRALFEK
jgi:gas vesicle protein